MKKNLDLKNFKLLVEKRLEGITDPLIRCTTILEMLQSNLIQLKNQDEELIDFLSKIMVLNKKDN